MSALDGRAGYRPTYARRRTDGCTAADLADAVLTASEAEVEIHLRPDFRMRSFYEQLTHAVELHTAHASV
jgi:hypothetical protein